MERLQKKSSVKFSALVKSQSRHVTATRFYDLLVLKNKDMINVKQPAPFQDIAISPTEHFHDDLGRRLSQGSV